MTTKNSRLNITIDEQYLGLLSMLSEKQGKSVSATAKDLIIKALELEEDFYFSKLSDDRLSNADKGSFISHEDAWK